MSTEQNGPGPDRPTAPIRRPVGGRDDEPTQVVETGSGAVGRPAPGHDAPPTAPLPTSGAPATAPLPTGGAPATAPLPTGGTPATTPLLASGAPATAPLSASGAPATGSLRSGAAEPVPDRAASVPAEASGAAALGSSTATATATATRTGHDATVVDETSGDTIRPDGRTLRVGTVVWGLIIAIIGAGLIAVAAGARFDLELVLIGLLALAGVSLVAGSMAVSMRRRR